MKRLAALTAAVVLIGGLGACAPERSAAADPNAGRVTTSWKIALENGDDWDSDWAEHQIQLSDGWYVTCVTYTGYREGSVSCDYDHPRRAVRR